MKMLTLLLLGSLSFSALADNSKLIASCLEVGTQKLQDQADIYGTILIESEIKECGVDARALNPFKYVWFCAPTSNGGTIKILTQKAPFKKCI